MDKRLAVYLAGKIAKNDWRHNLADLSVNDDGFDRMPKWDAVPIGRGGMPIDCVGPFFIGCDHGCAHGPNDHGVGASEPGCVNEPLRRREVVDRCLDAIRRCDVLFCWLDDPTAHGTLVEIGFAKASGKHVIVATHPHIAPEVRHDMWFAFEAADELVKAQDAVTAFWSVGWWRLAQQS